MISRVIIILDFQPQKSIANHTFPLKMNEIILENFAWCETQTFFKEYWMLDNLSLTKLQLLAYFKEQERH